MPENVKTARVWVLKGSRAGDNAQLDALARALPYDYEIKDLRYNGLFWLPNIALRATLSTLAGGADTVKPPWPDLVIGVGRRSVPVSLWIRQQSEGISKIVRIGRPRAPTSWFDLVITTPQYGLPRADNVYAASLPLTGPSATVEVCDWRARFAALPRPWIGVLVGGASDTHRFDGEIAARLVSQSEALAHTLNGSLLVSTSPRTPDEAVAALSTLNQPAHVPAHVHVWRRNTPNPHRAILEMADAFVVTGDSASMLAEAVRTAKPVYVFDVPEHGYCLHWNAQGGAAGWLARTGLLSPPRDMAKLHQALLAGGHIRPLGNATSFHPAPLPDDLAAAAARVRALLEPS